jgi:hypothetical protein
VDNINFTELRVRTFSLDFLELTWEIENTLLDVLDYTMYIERSESEMGPWDTVAGPFKDRYRFVDNRVNQLDRWRQIWYRIKSIENADTDNIEYSDPVLMAAEPDLIAAEVQRQERLLWEEYAGRRVFVFPIRTFGQRCGNCYDGHEKGKGFTSQRRRSHCATCYDTGFVRGYLSPIEVFMQIDPSPKTVQPLPVGERQQSDTRGRLPNFPLLKPRDIIVEAENRRWRVVQVNSTERLRSVVRQEPTLHEIAKGDIEFGLPIRLDSIKDFEPSPMRNFTNPQTLEAFEDAVINDVLGIYGYDT